MIIEPIFINFVAYEYPVLDNQKIENFCYHMREKDTEGRIVTNRGGWQSKDFEPPLNGLEELAGEVEKGFVELCKVFDIKPYESKRSVINNFWININTKDSRNIAHDHPGSLFVAVYYVKVPENSGSLILRSPVKNYQEYLPNDIVSKHNDFNSPLYIINPKVGNLVFFPSWLKHEVSPNLTGEDRISIAFNGYNMKEGF